MAHLRQAFASSRGIRIFCSNFLAAFGAISALIQFVGQLYPTAISSPLVMSLGTFGLCLIWGTARVLPRRKLSREFTQPEFTIRVLVGDLFDQEGHIIVGFSDTFDTTVRGNRVIHESSLQGQLIRRRYDGNQLRLDRELRSALTNLSPILSERRREKPHGKLKRYALGTVAVIGHPDRKIFAVAYSSMQNNLRASATANDLWTSLDSLWKAVRSSSQSRTISIPIVGSGLSRVNSLDRQSLIKMIMISFLSKSRESIVCRELRIIVWPPDADSINMLEIKAFLDSL